MFSIQCMTVAALLCVLRPLLVVQFLLFPSWSLDPNRLQHFVVAATENGTKNSKTETSTASKKSKATTTTSKPKAQNEKFSDKRGKSFFPLENDIDTGAKTVDWNHTDGRTVAAQVAQHLGISLLEDRFAQLFAKATSEECRAKIAHHAASFYHALATEVSLPFAAEQFGAPNECTETVHDWNNLPEGMHIGDIQNRSYQPPRNDNNTVYIEDPSQLKICYVILTHDNANSTIRLIESLYEAKPLHQFVIHVDAKYNQTQTILLDYAQDKEDYIYIVPDHNRVRVNWGGFSMVNATLQAMRYAFALDDDDNNEDNGDVNSNSRRHRRRSALDFHKLVHLSSSSYPLASNLEIRHKLASYPLDANFLHIILNPSRPGNHGWHYFVECDDALHRIYQLTPLRREVSGIDMYTSSQWFIISREFAEYLAKAEEGSMVERFLKYIQHVVVADETFFGTVLRNTKFCHCHHNDNFLHLQFDRWESDLPATQRDSRKCPMPDPDHCGRSPTTMTLDYADIMELSANLFARKFDDSIDTAVKDVIDRWRAERAFAIERQGHSPDSAFNMKKVNFEGHGVLIVAKDTISDATPLCLTIGPSGNKVVLLPCFEDWVPATLADHWETGAVVQRETVLHSRWSVGPCTTDGHVERLDSGDMNVTLGNYSKTGPRCMLQQMDGIRSGRCYDGGAMTFQPGGETQVYPCIREWFQFLSFGDGRVAPKGSLYSTIPSHIVKQIRNLGHEHIPYMCLGVYERGDEDELDWGDESYETDKKERATAKKMNSADLPANEWEPLTEWKGAAIVTTQCTNAGAVIEWVLVPFIEDETEFEDGLSINETLQPEANGEDLTNDEAEL